MSGIKCVVVRAALREHEPMAWDFVLNFARDNHLQVVEACLLPDDAIRKPPQPFMGLGLSIPRQALHEVCRKQHGTHKKTAWWRFFFFAGSAPVLQTAGGGKASPVRCLNEWLKRPMPGL